MMKLIYPIAALICMVSIAVPQDEHESKRREKMEMLAVWKLTEKLELTPDQAESFFPTYREHESTKKNIREQQKAIFKQLKEKDDISQSDVDAAVNQLSELEQQMFDAKNTYMAGMKNILTPEQQLNLLMFRGNFMKEMKGRLKDHKGRRGHPGDMKRKRDKRY